MRKQITSAIVNSTYVCINRYGCKEILQMHDDKLYLVALHVFKLTLLKLASCKLMLLPTQIPATNKNCKKMAIYFYLKTFSAQNVVPQYQLLCCE